MYLDTVERIVGENEVATRGATLKINERQPRVHEKSRQTNHRDVRFYRPKIS